MSEEKGKVPIGTIAGIAIAGGGVAGTLYLGYKYFVEPGNIILAQYRYILEDIYKETKKFLEDNANLSPPVYGLTPGQEAILKAKEGAAEYIRPEVEKILQQRNIDPNIWISELIIGILLVFGIPYVLDKVIGMIKTWRQKTEAESIQSSHGHGHMLYEIIANEMAYSGKLNIASAFLNNIQSYYTTYTEGAITAQIAFYNALIPGLTPGTLDYLVATQMLNYLTFEISAAGIMGSLWNFWLPPII